MARRRDHPSTFARRDELARERGYSSYGHERKMRREGTPLPTDTGVGKRRIYDLPDRKIVTGTAKGKGFADAERQLAGANRVLGIDVEWAGKSGRLLSKGGWDARRMEDLIRSEGSFLAAVAFLVALQYGDDAGGDVEDGGLDDWQLDLL